jgi:hypothetical protein
MKAFGRLEPARVTTPNNRFPLGCATSLHHIGIQLDLVFISFVHLIVGWLKNGQSPTRLK